MSPSTAQLKEIMRPVVGPQLQQPRFDSITNIIRKSGSGAVFGGDSVEGEKKVRAAGGSVDSHLVQACIESTTGMKYGLVVC